MVWFQHTSEIHVVKPWLSACMHAAAVVAEVWCGVQWPTTVIKVTVL
jgi:hypothetical protein